MREADAPVKRGRGRPTGPGLKTLLTQKFPDGASMADLVNAGFNGEVKRHIDAGEVALDDAGVYHWMIRETITAERYAAREEQNINGGKLVIEVPIAEIKIGERHRKEMGDLQPLADSIGVRGLLQPIGITASLDLVFGQRRIEAHKLLGRDMIPARIVNVPSTAVGEHDENELRKEFTPTERVAILQAIGRKPEGRPAGNQQDLANLSDAARAAGFGNKETARQAAAVVDTGTPELVESMDKGEISIDAAAQIAKQPAEEQKRVLALAPSERKAAVRTLRAPAKPASETRSSKLLKAGGAARVKTELSVAHAASQTDDDAAVSRLIPCTAKVAAAALIRHWSRDDIRAIVAALQNFLDSPVLQ